jgi:NAD(P)-dependent dehydrogenase (short-subunit alcohol dehydrogenase family)
MSTWLITGCSTGLGRALAEAVIAAGRNAVVTARDVAKVTDLADATPRRVLAVALDVTKPAQVTSAVQQADERFGGVDVLVNNAGYGYRGAVEEGDDADVRTLFETHFFGTVAMIKAVLPGMRARRSGAIVNISSIAARLTPVGSGYYAAAKAGIEGMSGALRGELAPLGISVTVVRPAHSEPTSRAARSPSRPRSSTTTRPPPDSAARKPTPWTATRPATPPRPAPPSSRPPNQASLPHCCCSDSTRWPPIATSQKHARTRSRNGKSSPAAPTLTEPQPRSAVPGAARA